RRAIFSPSLPGNIVAADAFHDRVRDGNGWDHVALPPERGSVRLTSYQSDRLAPVTHTDNCTGKFPRLSENTNHHLRLAIGQALERLVPLGYGHCCPSTVGLSARCSSAGLTWLTQWGNSSWGGLRT